MNVAELTEKLVRIPSVSGNEQAVVEYLAVRLRERFDVTLDEVEPGRSNIIAVKGKPRIIFNIHTDTVPGELPVRLENGVLYGRGACDAKGPMAAMILAAEQAVDDGLEGIGIFLDVGEEKDFCGLKKFAETAPDAELIIICEPTQLKMRYAQKGVLMGVLTEKGKSAHSSRPELGECAISKLMASLKKVQELSLAEDELLGKTTVSITQIEGGTAVNVVAGEAKATISCRPTRGETELRERIEEAVTGEISWINDCEAVVNDVPEVVHSALKTIGREPEAIAMPGFTGMYFWRKKGATIVIGPGDLKYAHSKEENITIKDLEEGQRFYAELIQQLLE